MIDNTSKISLTYKKGGEYLLRKGNYTVAELSTTPKEKYTKTDGSESMIRSVITNSKTVDEPIYSEPKQHVTLPYEFIKKGLERPDKPDKKAPIYEWNAYSQWETWSKAKKLNYRIHQLVSDLQGYDPVWQLI